jgi:dipeptidyl aminopeptidase/acylaminoacyl peptidase
MRQEMNFTDGMRARCLHVAALLLLSSVSIPLGLAAQARGATVQDSIAMVRIQHGVTPEDEVAAFSPDGTQAAFVTWRGDLARNTNLYELRLLDLRPPLGVRPAKTVLAREFPGERRDQQASPIKQLRFVQGGKAIAYLGLDGAGIAQAYLLDLATGNETQLTRHSSAIRTFTVGPGGKLLAFSAVLNPEDGSAQRMEDDGVFMWDTEVFPTQSKFTLISPVLSRLSGWNAVRQYFLVEGGRNRLIFDTRQSRPALPLDLKDEKVAAAPTQSLVDDSSLPFAVLPASPDGRHLLLYPYQLTEHPMHPEKYAYYGASHMNAYAHRTAPQVGVVDVATGRIEPLVDAPSPQFERYESGSPLWSPDGKSVIVYTLSPERPADPPAWVEVDLASRRVSSLGLEKDSRPLGWAEDGQALVLSRKGEQFGKVARASGGGWGKAVYNDVVKGFNPDWSVASDGRIVLGVRDGLKAAPELVAFDPATQRSTPLTDLNPQLAAVRMGEIAPYHWLSKPDAPADGFLVKPVGYQPGKRYPLVILLDDGTLRKEGEPYLLDGAWQLSGHATQMLAAQGFMVLYTREPPMRDVVETPAEGERIRTYTEAAVAKLDRDGLIDPSRIGIAGWSRAGYYTSYLLIHSSIKFAAASNIDGGASEYTDRMRPFTDGELKKVSAPILFNSHGLWSLVYHGAMADRLLALGRPADILYFQSASHSTTRPQHRLRSLGSNIDWWRFWLMDQEDPDPAKALQYKHWRGLRELQAKANSGSGK